MKALVLTALSILTFASINANAAQILNPTSGDRYTCYDGVSFLTYHIKIEDIGDQDAKVVVVDRKGKLVEKYTGKNDKIAFVNFDRGGFGFLMLENGEEVGTIYFEVYDLNSAVYSDGGDSRALDCKIAR